ncbi:MAG: hypothetical protein WBL91_02750, partial [Pseudolabrys sp.]
MQGRRNGERGQRSIKPIAVGVLDQDVSFEHRLCKFFDEQRVAVSFGDNLVHYFNWQGKAARYLGDYAFNGIATEATERHSAD